MNTKLLFAGVVAAAFTLTSFAAQPLLSPRAKGNQIKVVSYRETTPGIAVEYVSVAPAQLSPRAAGNQIKTVKGIAEDANPALACRANMNGTPKAVTECSSHANMPGCASVGAQQ